MGLLKFWFVIPIVMELILIFSFWMKEPDSSGDRKKRVPVVFVSGDDKACNEAKRLIKGVYTVETKIGMGREAAILNPVVKVREEITEYGRSPEENLLAPERSSTNRNP